MADVDDTKPYDSVAYLADAYGALEAIALERLGADDPCWILLFALNRHFRHVVASLDARGMLT